MRIIQAGSCRTKAEPEVHSHSAGTGVSVSVVIPTCDRPLLLPRAVSSVIRQSSRPLELLIVDDGCGQTRAAPLPQADFRIKVLTTGGYQGVSHARNLGAAAACGGYVAFLDDDDYWHEDFLSLTLLEAQRAQADFVAAGWFSVKPDNGVWPGKIPPVEYQVSEWVTANPGVTGSNFLIRRSLFRAVGGFDERLPPCEDRDLVIRLIQQGARFGRVEERLMYRSFHSGDRLTNFSRRRLLATLAFFRKHRAMLSGHRYRRQRAARFLDAATYYFATRRELRLRYIWWALLCDPRLVAARLLKTQHVLSSR